MILGMLGTQNGTTESMHKWEGIIQEAFKGTTSHFKLLIDLFDGEEKIIRDSDIIMLFHKDGDEKTGKLIRECIAEKKTFICIADYYKEEKYGGFQKAVKEADPKVRHNTARNKGIIGRFKKR